MRIQAVEFSERYTGEKHHLTNTMGYQFMNRRGHRTTSHQWQINIIMDGKWLLMFHENQ